jgi:hypothetical protein
MSEGIWRRAILSKSVGNLAAADSSTPHPEDAADRDFASSSDIDIILLANVLRYEMRAHSLIIIISTNPHSFVSFTRLERKRNKGGAKGGLDFGRDQAEFAPKDLKEN